MQKGSVLPPNPAQRALYSTQSAQCVSMEKMDSIHLEHSHLALNVTHDLHHNGKVCVPKKTLALHHGVKDAESPC